ncbi:hypothetical protein CU044_6485 [Streptomyces sp. L-9-10]|nr:hypothetical protein CU044_6485 [Streptomyces sp. L-9-10]
MHGLFGPLCEWPDVRDGVTTSLAMLMGTGRYSGKWGPVTAG